MRRLGRYIFNGLTVLSLLICLATVVLWVRVEPLSDCVEWNTKEVNFSLCAYPAGVQFMKLIAPAPDEIKPHRPYGPPTWPEGWRYSRETRYRDGNGFVFGKPTYFKGFKVGLPYWLICVITLAPGARLALRLRRKRPPPGLCPKCRYDLRATPDRCPECGTVVAEAGKKTD